MWHYACYCSQALGSWSSEAVALALAQAAHRRAAHLSAFGSPILGMGVAAVSGNTCGSLLLYIVARRSFDVGLPWACRG
jgi:hypothetical protein